MKTLPDLGQSNQEMLGIYQNLLIRGLVNYLSYVDFSRRSLGHLLDQFGLGPIETPSQIIFSEPGVRLHSYGSYERNSPILLIIPAPIKSASIWDLSPTTSPVAHCLREGIGVYLLEWEPPGSNSEKFGLSEYADRLILDCLEKISSITGQKKIFLAGHSLGGTLATLYSSMHPDRVKGLILLGTPIAFAIDSGTLTSRVKRLSSTSLLFPQQINIPGSFLSISSALAAPEAFVFFRWFDWFRSLPYEEARLTHLRVVHWTLSEMPMSERLFKEIIQRLYGEDSFLRGTLTIGEKRATPEQVMAPILSVVDRDCQVVEPESVTRFYQALSHRSCKLLWYEGDTGVALEHVGMLVGREAHLQIWPKIIEWMGEIWENR